MMVSFLALVVAQTSSAWTLPRWNVKVVRATKTKTKKSESPSTTASSSENRYEPSVPVAINGGDPWIGWRVTGDELSELCEAATSTIRGRPVMKQFHPRRSWLWRQWHGTIVRSVLQTEVKLNMAWAVVAVGVVWHLVPRALLSLQQSGCTGALGGFLSPVLGLTAMTHEPTVAAFRDVVIANLKPVENFWALTQTLVAFVLSFFLSQTYAVWRDVYTIARRVQGRLSDQGLILATNAERDDREPSRPYTRRSIETIELWARYARLFNMLFFASVTRRFAPLNTPKGLQALQTQGAITADEVERLISTTSWHQTVALWMATLVTTAVDDGRIRGGASVAYQSNVNTANLRSHYAQMADKLSGRMPLAYTHLVQLFVDTLCFAAPLALVGPLGAAGAVVGTGAVTLFYAGVLALAKMFLDPFDNEDYGGRSGIRLEADVLVQEVNALTRRWSTAVRAGVPKAVYDPPELDRYKDYPNLLPEKTTAEDEVRLLEGDSSGSGDPSDEKTSNAKHASRLRKNGVPANATGPDVKNAIDANFEEETDDAAENAETTVQIIRRLPSDDKSKVKNRTTSYSLYQQPLEDAPDVSALRTANDDSPDDVDVAPPFLLQKDTTAHAASSPNDDADNKQTLISIQVQLFPPKVNTSVTKTTRSSRRKKKPRLALLNRRRHRQSDDDADDASRAA